MKGAGGAQGSNDATAGRAHLLELLLLDLAAGNAEAGARITAGSRKVEEVVVAGNGNAQILGAGSGKAHVILAAGNGNAQVLGAEKGSSAVLHAGNGEAWNSAAKRTKVLIRHHRPVTKTYASITTPHHHYAII